MINRKYTGVFNGVIFVVAIAIIIAAFLNFAKSNKERISAQNMQYIRDSAVRTAEIADAEITRGLNELQIISGFIADSMTSPEVDYAKISAVSEKSSLDFIEFVDPEGNNHNVTGGISDARDRRYFIEGIRGNTGVDVVFNSRATHETLVDLYTPVIYNDRVCGVLVGVLQASNRLTELLTVDLFGERADTFLINPEGRAVASNLVFDTSLELTVSVIAGGDSAAADKLNIAVENGCTTSFTLADRAGCITRLPENGWFLMQLMPRTVSASMENGAIFSGVKLEIVVVSVMLLVGVILVILYRRSSRVLEGTTDELTGYKNAVLSDASIAFDADISNNVITGGAWKGANGRLVAIEDLLGISLPCSYDEYITRWADRFVDKEYRELFLEKTSRENMMRSIAQGRNEISFDYGAKAADGSNIFARRSILLAHNSKGAVIAYCSVKNISAQHRREEKMLQYERMLATVASGTYKGIRVIELENFTSTYLSFENGQISEQEIGSWTVWLTKQRKNVHPDDFDKLRSMITESALSKMELNTSVSIDYRNAKCGEDGKYRTYRSTAFRTESSGKPYVYLVTVDTTDEVSKAKALTT